MYTPASFQIENFERVRLFVAKNHFAIIISQGAAQFQDTHTPLVLTEDGKCLEGHIAKANGQWRFWASDPIVKVIFHGPHTYISPRYYRSEFNVPTWNYSAVSMDGEVEIVDSEKECRRILHRLIEINEAGAAEPWKLDESDPRYVKLFQAIVFFRIKIRSVEAKFKLNQNKSVEDRLSVIEHLLASGDPMDLAVARLMREEEELRGGI